MSEEAESIKKEKIDNPDGTYTVKIAYYEGDDNGWKSTIEKYDSYSNFLYGEYYQDCDFNALGQKTVKTTHYNGSYRYTKTRTIPDRNGWFVINELFDSNNKLLSGIYETSPEDANQVILKQTMKYNNDGTYERHCSYVKQRRDLDYFSFIEQFDKDNKFLSSKFYKDRNFINLYFCCDRETLSESHYIDKIVEDCIINGCRYKSRTKEVVLNKQIEKEFFYKNKDFTELIASAYNYINKDGNSVKGISCEDNPNGCHSTIFETDKQGRLVRQIWFVDRDMQQQYSENIFEYQDNDNYTCKTTYFKKAEQDQYNTIKFYNNGVLTKTQYYMFKKKAIYQYNELYITETYEYLPNGRYIARSVFNETSKNMLSRIEYRDKNDRCMYGMEYTDKEFKTLYRRNWIKYKKNSNNGIRLRRYEQVQEGGFNTEIEKLDFERNVLSVKQYNVNYLTAKLLFMMARW